MKTATLAAVAAAVAGIAFAPSASASTTTPATPTIQPSWPEAPAIARSYLKHQAGRQLTMSRADVIAAITKLTGPDGEFAASNRATRDIPVQFTSTSTK
ncbi:MAG: hypothetical protein NVSMB53_19450 [Gemmatimonadaceae bacterium]